MFLIFKAIFLAKHKELIQGSRNNRVMSKLHQWLDDNVQDLYNNFMAAKPSY